MQYIIYLFHAIAQVLHYLNPIMMAFTTILWVVLYMRMSKQLNRMYMRCYALERQVEHIVDREKIDPGFINCMRILGEDYGR